MSLVFSLTPGSIRTEGRPFLDDLSQASPSSYLSAFAGGIVFNFANILIMAATA